VDTYATLLLTIGIASIDWIAEQMGSVGSLTPLGESSRRPLLKLVEIAFVNEACAADLKTILDNFTGEDATSLRSIITALQTQKRRLQRLSKDVVTAYQ